VREYVEHFFSRKNGVLSVANGDRRSIEIRLHASVIFVDPRVQIDETGFVLRGHCRPAKVNALTKYARSSIAYVLASRPTSKPVELLTLSNVRCYTPRHQTWSR